MVTRLFLITRLC